MKVVALGFLAVVLFYGFYCGAAAIWSYWELSNIVERSVEQRGRVSAASVREAILQATADARIPLEDRNAAVSEDGGVYLIKLKWSWPVISYRGDQVVEIPLSMEQKLRRP